MCHFFNDNRKGKNNRNNYKLAKKGMNQVGAKWLFQGYSCFSLSNSKGQSSENYAAKVFYERMTLYSVQSERGACREGTEFLHFQANPLPLDIRIFGSNLMLKIFLYIRISSAMFQCVFC